MTRPPSLLDRCDEGARAVLIGAQTQARALGHAEVQADHLLLALLTTPTPARDLLTGPGTDRAALDSLLGEARRQVAARLTRPGARRADRARAAALGQSLVFTPSAREVLTRAATEALSLRHDRLGPEHLLLAVLAGPPAGLVTTLGLSADYDEVRARVAAGD